MEKHGGWQTALRRKRILIPFGCLLTFIVGIWAINAKLMSDESLVFSVGSAIRSRLGDLASDFKKGDFQAVAAFYSEAYSGSDLGFSDRYPISEENGIVLEEWQAVQAAGVNKDQLLGQLKIYRKALHDLEKVKFKMVHLNEYSATSANILMRFQVYSKDSGNYRTEDRGHFIVDLVLEDGDWIIVGQTLVDGRRAIGKEADYFVDVTQEAGIDFNTGINPVFKHLKFNFGIVNRAAGGVSSGDYDQDGYPDLFFAGSMGSKLYRNTGGSGFTDVTQTAFAPEDMEKIGYAQGGIFADYNNDGHLDIYITKTPRLQREYLMHDWPLESADELLAFMEASPVDAMRVSQLFEMDQDRLEALLEQAPTKLSGMVDEVVERWQNRLSNRLLKNNGDGTFTDVTEAAGLFFNSYCVTSGFADIENDGDLDLYVSVYGAAKFHSPDPPFHDRYGLPNQLFRNNGDGTFTEIGAEAGVDDTGWTLGMTFLDYDNDGDQDLHVANDFGYNSLFQNDGTGRFEDVSKQAGTSDYGFGMCSSPGDYDNDGDLDLYISNLYSGTTWYLQHAIMQFLWVRLIDPARTLRSLEVAYQSFSRMSSLDELIDIGKKFGEGNSLLQNNGDGTFRSRGVEKGVMMGGWAWGSNFLDFDNDGDLDIHCVNGWVTGKDYTDL